MDYMSERVKNLRKEAESIIWDDKQAHFIKNLLETLECIAQLTDDLVDATGELDDRLYETEERLNSGDGPE